MSDAWSDIDPINSGIAAEFVGVRPSASRCRLCNQAGTMQTKTRATGTTDITGYPNGNVFTARAVYRHHRCHQPTVAASIDPASGATSH